MAESFGNEFTIVEVTSDGAEPEVQMWLAVAKPSQAVTLSFRPFPKVGPRKFCRPLSQKSSGDCCTRSNSSPAMCTNSQNKAAHQTGQRLPKAHGDPAAGDSSQKESGKR
jgi:hypothetical protein